VNKSRLIRHSVFCRMAASPLIVPEPVDPNALTACLITFQFVAVDVSSTCL
jgi:hypothetical protein